ncbi:putative RNA recognition motif domain-containing protein [Medicago truncatula]|uniref:Putative RNA recognition motif domain-containing protein n=1 Tax=Medicago truncatula TaxID=3880 RepID=A0A396HV83_MEDTR|nr:putative RNA recognition motif domain-containing protein [Medicago truncatula]
MNGSAFLLFGVIFLTGWVANGSAEVVYNRRSDAFAALKRYNNVLLDGKPMKIEIVGTNSELPVTARVNVSAMNRQRKRTFVMTYCSASAFGVAEFVVTIGLFVSVTRLDCLQSVQFFQLLA